MWTIKVFKTFEEMDKWARANKSKYYMHQIFLNNGYGIEYKPMRVM